MSLEHSNSSVIDVRSLPSAREVLAYREGGLFPVLTTAPDGSAVAVLHGGAGHLGQDGHIDIVRSRDGGLTWTQPQIVANSETDDRNPAFGVSNKGTLILSYHRTFAYDAEGRYVVYSDPHGDWPCEVMVTRSLDSGLTWEEPWVLNEPILRHGSPFGKIVSLPNGTLLMPIYARPVESLGVDMSRMHPKDSCSYLVRSHDDGMTWEQPSVIAINAGETAVMVLPDGDVLALVRREQMGKTLWSTRSSDGGLTWTEPLQVAGDMEHQADLLVLKNGDVLMVYGNRNNPPLRVEGRVSRDGGRSWLPCLLVFSGSLGGYNCLSVTRVDLGYPSSTLAAGHGITMYYYNPVMPVSQDWRSKGRKGLSPENYLAVAVVWDQEELIAAVDRMAG